MADTHIIYGKAYGYPYRVKRLYRVFNSYRAPRDQIAFKVAPSKFNIPNTIYGSLTKNKALTYSITFCPFL